MNHRIAIGKRVSEIRQAKGITQEQFSEIAGINRVNISKIENGRYNLSIDILKKVCDALDLDIELRER